MMRYQALAIPSPVVPYVRMTRRSKYASDRAQRYLSNQAVLRALMANEMVGREPFARTPLKVDMAFYEAGSVDHRRDLDNLVKAVLDAGKGVLWEDDRWIDEVRATREAWEHDEDQVSILIWEMN